MWRCSLMCKRTFSPCRCGALQVATFAARALLKRSQPAGAAETRVEGAFGEDAPATSSDDSGFPSEDVRSFLRTRCCSAVSRPPTLRHSLMPPPPKDSDSNSSHSIASLPA